MSFEFNGKTLLSGFQLDDDVSEKLFLTALDITACLQVEDLEESLHTFLLVSLLQESEKAEYASSRKEFLNFCKQ